MYRKYFDDVTKLLHRTDVRGIIGTKELQHFPIDIERACRDFAEAACAARNTRHKLIFIGNGGSSAIASHLAVDFQKRAGIATLVFSDASMLTCLSNDLGYERVFTEQLAHHANTNDLVICISSSGKSQNILSAAALALKLQCHVYTFSGFDESNPLRDLGHVNFYTPSSDYGEVELAHFTILHSIVDGIVKEQEHGK